LSKLNLKYCNKIVCWIIIGLACPLMAWATHNRAGEITYKQISAYTYQVTLVTYTDSRSVSADRPSVDIIWGDGKTSTIVRNSQSFAGKYLNTYINVYSGQHTFNGPGTYLIQFLDPNRVQGIVNVSNSINTAFYVESQLQINPTRGFNSSPILLQPPIDFAQVNKRFIHNPNAYDADGDSLSYILIPPKEKQGVNVNYVTPKASNSFSLNPITGDLIWDAPIAIGIYNIAIEIDEYRNGLKIGYVIRDMQIWVQNGNNHPPVIAPLKDTCVEAGKSATFWFRVKAKDIDTQQTITLTATGGPFLQKIFPATYNPGPAIGKDSVKTNVQWQIPCDAIRKQPYKIVFRAVDNDPDLPLSDIKQMNIRVVGPAPINLVAVAMGNGVKLNWNPPPTCNPIAYFVYRRSDSSKWNPTRCQVGIPSYLGFELIDTILNNTITNYFDDNKNGGLSPGVEYCYRITAVYLQNGQFEYVEGYASNEQCIKLKKDVPVITNISITKTSNGWGKSYIAFSKPTDLDTSQYPGPYQYKFFRNNGYDASKGTNILTIQKDYFSQMNDTLLLDKNLNTITNPYAYKVEFYCRIDSKPFYIGKTINASSIYLTTKAGHQKIDLTWKSKQPWKIFYYVVERKNPSTNLYDTLKLTKKYFYSDSNLVLGKSYCYRITSVGTYGSSGFTNPLINLSNEVCDYPKDTIKPCTTKIKLDSDCPNATNTITWSADTANCQLDVTAYKLYFAYRKSNQFKVIDSFGISVYPNRKYLDQRPILAQNLAGCYVMTCIDSFGNESLFSDTLCSDNCPNYSIPNIITPNGDGKNDELTPFQGWKYIFKIDLKIFNRWGQEVFKTNNPEIKWNGNDQKSDNPLAPGTYFYYLKVTELLLNEDHELPIQKGIIEIIR